MQVFNDIKAVQKARSGPYGAESIKGNLSTAPHNYVLTLADMRSFTTPISMDALEQTSLIFELNKSNVDLERGWKIARKLTGYNVTIIPVSHCFCLHRLEFNPLLQHHPIPLITKKTLDFLGSVPFMVPEWGGTMAAKRRHWKEKGGRFYARIAVPKALAMMRGKSELLEPLGGDLRVADRTHSAAVGRLQEQIAAAQRVVGPAHTNPSDDRSPITNADIERAVWLHYTGLLQNDDQNRAAMPSNKEIDAEAERFLDEIYTGKIDGARGPIGMINAFADYESMRATRQNAGNIRARRLAAIKSELASGDSRLIDAAAKEYITYNKLNVEPASRKWRDLAKSLARAEIQAL